MSIYRQGVFGTPINLEIYYLPTIYFRKETNKMNNDKLKKTASDSVSFVYIFKAMELIRNNKKLLKYSLIQIIISTLIFITSFYFVVTEGYTLYYSWLGEWILDSAAWYLIASYYVLIVPFYLILLIISFYAIMLTTQIFIAPFNTMLSVKVEEIYTGNKFVDELPFMKQLQRDVLYELRKVFFFLILIIIPLPILLIPVVGQVTYTVIASLVLMYTLTFDFVDYPMERDKLELRDRINLVYKHKAIWLGYGGSVFLLFMIPLLNIALWPVLITSGTLLYIDKLKVSRD